MSVLNLTNINSQTVTVTATVASAAVPVNCTTGMLLIVNTGSVAVYVAADGASVTANTSTSLCIPPETAFTLRVHPTFTHVAVIAESSTSKVAITSANGGVYS